MKTRSILMATAVAFTFMSRVTGSFGKQGATEPANAANAAFPTGSGIRTDRLARVKSLTEKVEQPAQTTEVEIWRELLQGQKARTGLR